VKLFEIPDAIRAAVNDPEVVDPETGEVLQPWVLGDLDKEKGRIVLFLAKLAIEQIAEGEAVKAQADRLAKRAASHGGRADSLKRYIAGCCEKGEKFADDTVRVNVMESTSCEVIDAEKIPATFFSTPKPPKPVLDKKSLLASLRGGANVMGAALKRTPYTKIS